MEFEEILLYIQLNYTVVPINTQVSSKSDNAFLQKCRTRDSQTQADNKE